uniref:Uncharacterized protein n=1 Tax=Arundo donax TaxID=35708 RepID=A0A0A9EJJ1_ARUDO
MSSSRAQHHLFCYSCNKTAQKQLTCLTSRHLSESIITSFAQPPSLLHW